MISLENAQSCGTTLCVAGWCVVREGFTVNANTEKVLGKKSYFKIFGVEFSSSTYISKKAGEILELTEDEEEALFFPNEERQSIYPKSASHDPKKSAQYIRQFVAIHDPEGYSAYQAKPIQEVQNGGKTEAVVQHQRM